MEEYLEVLESTKLFSEFSREEILLMIGCLEPKVIEFSKDEAILIAGGRVQKVGIVLKGEIRIEKEDVDGNVLIVDELCVSEMFGEAFVFSQVEEVPINIWSVGSSKIMFIDYNKIINVCPSSCGFHIKLIKNMLKVMATKLIMINQKMDIVQKKSTKEKILSFLKSQQKYKTNEYFEISFNKSELANYLGINRSAMSRELKKMKDENVIDFNGKKFKII